MKKLDRALAAAALVTGALMAQSAAAQGWGSGRVIVESNRGATVIDREVTGAPGARQGSTTVTHPNGTTSTRDFSRSYDPESGSFSRESTATGPYGGSRSVYGSTTQTGPGEFYNERTVITPHGASRTSGRWIRVEPAQ